MATVNFQEVSKKTTVFLDVALRSLAETDRHSRGAYCHHAAIIMPSEKPVNFYAATRCNISGDGHLNGSNMCAELMITEPRGCPSSTNGRQPDSLTRPKKRF
jgi:hypothetical protein